MKLCMTVRGLSSVLRMPCLLQVWHHALQFTAELLLEGIARAGAKSRCTMMGRAAMSLDLQASQHLCNLFCAKFCTVLFLFLFVWVCAERVAAAGAGLRWSFKQQQ